MANQAARQKKLFPSVLGSVAVTVISVVMCLALLEVCARRLYPSPPSTTGAFESDPKYMFLPRPGGKAISKVGCSGTEPLSCPVEISSQGLHDREYGPKENNEFRILLLGDSFTGGGCPPEAAIPRQLEPLLDGALPGKRVTVINAGCGGAGPLQELGMLRERGLALDPDLAILQLYPENDVDNCLYDVGKIVRAYNVPARTSLLAFQYARLTPYVIQRRLWFGCGLYRAFAATTRQPDFFVHLWNACRLLPIAEVPTLPPCEDRPFWSEVDLEQWYPELDEGMTLVEQNVVAIRDECHQRGIDLLAYTIPNWLEVDDAAWKAMTDEYEGKASYERMKGVRVFEECLRNNAIPVIPVSDAIRSLPDVREFYCLTDWHLNEAGKRLVAECIRDHLVKGHFLAKRGEIGSLQRPSRALAPPTRD